MTARDVVLFMGQSQGTGYGASPPLSTSQPFSLMRYTAGGLVPLKEDRDASLGTSGTLVESPVTAFMTEACSQGAIGMDAIAVNVSRNSAPWSEIKKGGSGAESGATGTLSWAQAVAALTAIKALGDAEGWAPVVRAVVWIHGQSDNRFGHTQAYGDYLRQSWTDAQTDFKAITGQGEDIPFVLSQDGTGTAYDLGEELMASTMLEAALQDPEKFVLGATGYRYAASDGKHFTNAGSYLLGEDLGAAFARHVIDDGAPPLVPSAIVMDGDVLTVTFANVAGALQLDETEIAGVTNFGFVFHDAKGVTVTEFELGTDTISFRGSDVWPDTARVSYAYAGAAPGSWHGPATGNRGQLRDDEGFAPAFGPGLVDPTGGWSSVELGPTPWLSFDGAGDYLITPSSPAVSPSGELWFHVRIKIPNLSQKRALVSKSSTGHSSFGIYVSATGSLFAVAATSASAGDTAYDATPAGTILVDVEYDVDVVFNGALAEADRWKFYVDGANVPRTLFSGTTPATIRADTASLRIGRYQLGSGGSGDANERAFIGVMRNVVFGLKAPTATEVATMRNGGVLRTPFGIGAALDAGIRVWLHGRNRHTTLAGKRTGTLEGFSGICSGTYPSGSDNAACVAALSGRPPAFDGETGAISNQAPGYETTRFTRGGNLGFA